MGNDKKHIVLYEDKNTPVVVTGEWAQMAYGLEEHKRARFILTCVGVALNAPGYERFTGFDDEELQSCWERTRIKRPEGKPAKVGRISITKTNKEREK